jgi:hypothetical protein
MGDKNPQSGASKSITPMKNIKNPFALRNGLSTMIDAGFLNVVVAMFFPLVETHITIAAIMHLV